MHFLKIYGKGFLSLGILALGMAFLSAVQSAAELVVASVSPKATGLNGVRIYPNPFYQNKGQTQVTIDGLPEGASVKVYTLNGELVWEGKASAAGNLSWAGVNKAGRKAAGGLYLAHFKSGGKKTVKKLSIVR